MLVIVYKCVRSPLGIRCRLLQVDCSDLAVSGENFIDPLIRRKHCVDRKGNKKSCAILIGKVISLRVAHYLRSLVEVRKLHLNLVSINFKLVLLSLIISPASTAYQLIPNECKWRLRRFIWDHLYLFDLSVNEEMLIEFLFSDSFRKVANPKLSHPKITTPINFYTYRRTLFFLLSRGSRRGLLVPLLLLAALMSATSMSLLRWGRCRGLLVVMMAFAAVFAPASTPFSVVPVRAVSVAVSFSITIWWRLGGTWCCHFLNLDVPFALLNELIFNTFTISLSTYYYNCCNEVLVTCLTSGTERYF